MRLRLITVALVATPASAGDSASASVDVYDDGAVLVVAPVVRATVDREAVRVDGGWTVDVVSGATPGLGVDIVSTATPFDDVRNQADLAVTLRPRADRSVRVGYTGSAESDFTSHAPSVKASWDLLDRSATVSARYGASFERAWVSGGDPIEQRSFAQRVDLVWTQIVDRRTTGAVSLAGDWALCGDLIGCSASPYRWVPVEVGGAPSLSLRERHPEQRSGLSAAVKLSRRVGPLGLHVEAAGSADTWGVLGHTERLATSLETLEEHLLLGLEGRFHAQSDATFFQETYATPGSLPGWRTADGELAGVRDGSVGGRAQWSFYGVGPLVRLGPSVRAARLWYVYPTLPVPPRQGAWIVGGGVDAEF